MDQRLRAAVESSPSGLLMTDQSGRIVLVNAEIERMFGYPRDELLGQLVDKLVPMSLREAHPARRAEFFADPKVRAIGPGRDLRGVRKDESEVPVEIGLTPCTSAEGLFVIASVVDITARKAAEQERQVLEEQLRHAQKMEAVGTLAGGIAHDFNNILSGVMGYLELLAPALVDNPTARDDVREIMNATIRGRDLVQRLLTFSRRHEPHRAPLDLGQTTRDALALIRRTMGAPIELEERIAPEIPPVSADATSVHQVLINLATNAAQAMPRGGTVEVMLEPVYVRDSVARSNPDLHEGPYVRLTVADNGAGIDPTIQARVFEPFFTTKAPGTSSGLGLAMVHGIMRDHEGAIQLDSELGRGTRITCFFPALPREEAAPRAAAPAESGRGERVLYVDDEPSLARAGKRRLEMLGYTVTSALGAEPALEAFRADPDGFDLVLTDYLMPKKTGLDLARELHDIRTDLKIIMITGFLEVSPDAIFAAGVNRLLPKPTSIDDLGAAIRAVLDA